MIKINTKINVNSLVLFIAIILGIDAYGVYQKSDINYYSDGRKLQAIKEIFENKREKKTKVTDKSAVYELIESVSKENVHISSITKKDLNSTAEQFISKTIQIYENKNIKIEINISEIDKNGKLRKKKIDAIYYGGRLAEYKSMIGDNEMESTIILGEDKNVYEITDPCNVIIEKVIANILSNNKSNKHDLGTMDRLREEMNEKVSLINKIDSHEETGE